MMQNISLVPIIEDVDCEQTKEISVKNSVKIEKKKESCVQNSEATITSPPVDINDTKIVKENTVCGPVVKKQLWKLIRGKFLITFYLCQECQNNLFYSQEKFGENSTGITLKIDLCNKCVDANCKATDILAPYKKIGQKRKAD
uniref:Uncharacterized protein n=1 Tax=Meloidogyne incognita TaxID=6306 RepID=A0A914M4R9_MELIC